MTLGFGANCLGCARRIRECARASASRVGGEWEEMQSGDDGNKDERIVLGSHRSRQASRIPAQAFALFLKELTSQDGIPVKVSGELSHLMGNQKQMRDIEGTRFFRDFERYVDSVKESLFKTEDERKQIGRAHV